MAELLSDNPDVMSSLLRALCDPGQVTPRAPLETLQSWQRRAVIIHAVPYIAAAERQRLYAELGNDYWVIFTDDGWTTEHSVECRLSGQMSSCAWHEAVRRIAGELYPPYMAGRWLITAIDGNGEPALVRADLIEGSR